MPAASAWDDATNVLAPRGEFDLTNTPQFQHEVLEALERKPNLVIDLSGVSFLDSSMLHALIRGRQRARERDGHLCVVRPDPIVWRVFEITGLDGQLPAHASVREALDSVAETS